MSSLNQLLWIASAVSVGNLVAIKVHAETWQAREKGSRWLYGAGVAGGVLALLFTLFLWWEIGSEFMDYTPPPEVAGPQRRLLLLVSGGLLASFVAIGFVHKPQIPLPSKTPLAAWNYALFALWGEVLINFVTCCAVAYSTMAFAEAFNIGVTGSRYRDESQWHSFFLGSSVCSLFLLALLRGWVVNLRAQFLQIGREWFRLK